MLKIRSVTAALFTVAALLSGMVLNFGVVSAEDITYQDFENVSDISETGWTIQKEAGLPPTLESNIGDNTGKSLALNADNAVLTAGDPQIRYYFPETIDKTKAYTMKTRIYLQDSSAGQYYIRIYNNSNGGAQLTFRSDKNIGGSTNGATWSEGWHDLTITVTPANRWYAYFDNELITVNSGLFGNGTSNDLEYVSILSVHNDFSAPVTSCIAIDDFAVFNGKDYTVGNAGFSWDIDDQTAPTGVTYNNGLTEKFETNVFGDESKYISLVMEYAENNSPMMNIENPLAYLSGHEVISYSFDLGIDSFSSSRDSLPPYFFQLFENGSVINSRNTGMSIDETGRISFFGTETDKTISAGEWHNFKYLLAANSSNDILNASLYVDDEYVCSADLTIQSPTEISAITAARFCNNSTGSVLYADNIAFEAEKAELLETSDETTAEMINADDYEIFVYLAPVMTAGEFSAAVPNAVVMTKDGQPADASSLLRNCDVYTGTESGYPIKWDMVINSADYIIKDERFDGEVASQEPGPDLVKLYESGDIDFYGQAKCASIASSSTVGGRDADDKSIVITGNNVDITANGGDPYVRFSLGYGESITTFECSIYSDGQQAAVVQPSYSADGSYVNALRLSADGSASVLGQTVEGYTWKNADDEARWIPVAITINAETNIMTVRVDGEIIAERSVDNMVYGYKIISLYSANNTSGTLAIDDMSFYTGEFNNYNVTYYADGTETENIEEADRVDVTVSASYNGEPVIAAYTDGILSDISLKDGPYSRTISVDSLTENDTVKLYLWDGVDTMKPLDAAVTLK